MPRFFQKHPVLILAGFFAAAFVWRRFLGAFYPIDLKDPAFSDLFAASQSA